MKRLALPLALALPLPALALELPQDLLSIELGPNFRAYDISNDAGLEASVSAVFLGFHLAMVTSDGILLKMESDLLGGLAISILSEDGNTDPTTGQKNRASGARIFRFSSHVPIWDLADTSAIGLGFDFDWTGSWSPANPVTGDYTPSEVTAGAGFVSFGLSGDLFHLPSPGHLAHAWLTLGAMIDLDNGLSEDEDSAFFVGPLVRAEAEYIWEFTDLIALHPRASVSWYGFDGVIHYSPEWSPSSSIEWTLMLGIGIELDFDDD